MILLLIYLIGCIAVFGYAAGYIQGANYEYLSYEDIIVSLFCVLLSWLTIVLIIVEVKKDTDYFSNLVSQIVKLFSKKWLSKRIQIRNYGNSDT